MFDNSIHCLTFVYAASFCLILGQSAFGQDNTAQWKVDKTSGEVWIVTAGAQNVALTAETQLNAGDSIRTAGNGRVMLRRGEETILISPNSVVGLPAEAKPGSTKIIQQAGSILLEVNKRDARTFAVETPYLVAAVKGTQFAVTVGAKGANVNVRHGSVEVADNKSGKFALVLPGQSATVSALGNGGFTLRGSGVLSPIQNGTPNAAPIGRVPVPRGGLTSPISTRASQTSPAAPSVSSNTGGALRISAPIGQVRLDVQAATGGLAREAGPPAAGRGSQTIWNGGDGRANSSANGSNSSSSGRSSEGNGNNGRGNGNGSAAAAANSAGNGNNDFENSGNGNNGKGKSRSNAGNDDHGDRGKSKGRGNAGNADHGNDDSSKGKGRGNLGNDDKGNGNSGKGKGNSGNGEGNNGSGIGNGGGNGIGSNGHGNGHGPNKGFGNGSVKGK